MFLYELGACEQFRRRGIGAAPVDALRDVASARGCYGMWVLVEDGNETAARAMYGKLAPDEPGSQTMLGWNL